MLCKLVCHCNLLFYCFLGFLIKNNNESIFCFSLKKWKVHRYKQNRQLSFLVKHDTKIINLKVKAHEKRNSCSRNLNHKWKERVECWRLGMHDIYRSDKLSTDMGENYVIFIAPINKWNPISRPNKVRLLQNQSISLIYLRDSSSFRQQVTWFKFQWLSACVVLITSSFVNMSSPVCKFFSVAEEDNAIAICNACSARTPRGGTKASSFTLTNQTFHLKGRHHGEAVLKDFKQPPLLER